MLNVQAGAIKDALGVETHVVVITWKGSDLEPEARQSALPLRVARRLAAALLNATIACESDLTSEENHGRIIHG